MSWKHVNFYEKYIFRDTGNLLPASGVIRRPEYQYTPENDSNEILTP